MPQAHMQQSALVLASVPSAFMREDTKSSYFVAQEVDTEHQCPTRIPAQETMALERRRMHHVHKTNFLLTITVLCATGSGLSAVSGPAEQPARGTKAPQRRRGPSAHAARP